MIAFNGNGGSGPDVVECWMPKHYKLVTREHTGTLFLQEENYVVFLHRCPYENNPDVLLWAAFAVIGYFEPEDEPGTELPYFARAADPTDPEGTSDPDEAVSVLRFVAYPSGCFEITLESADTDAEQWGHFCSATDLMLTQRLMMYLYALSQKIFSGDIDVPCESS